MKIAVLGADTELGRRIVNAAEAAGIQVVSVVEHFTSSIGNGPLIIKEVRELSINDLSKCHAVIDTLSFPRIEAYGTENLPFWHVRNLIKNSPIKLIAVGSSAFLYTDKKRDTFVRDMDGIHFDNNEKLDNVFLGLEYITVGQLLALFKSMPMSIPFCFWQIIFG